MRRDPLGLTLTLPGSASLGTFQAGALAALAVVIDESRRQGRPVRLDAIGGASAGSIVMLLFAQPGLVLGVLEARDRRHPTAVVAPAPAVITDDPAKLTGRRRPS